MQIGLSFFGDHKSQRRTVADRTSAIQQSRRHCRVLTFRWICWVSHKNFFRLQWPKNHSDTFNKHLGSDLGLIIKKIVKWKTKLTVRERPKQINTLRIPPVQSRQGAYKILGFPFNQFLVQTSPSCLLAGNPHNDRKTKDLNKGHICWTRLCSNLYNAEALEKLSPSRWTSFPSVRYSTSSLKKLENFSLYVSF